MELISWKTLQLSRPERSHNNLPTFQLYSIFSLRRSLFLSPPLYQITGWLGETENPEFTYPPLPPPVFSFLGKPKFCLPHMPLAVMGPVSGRRGPISCVPMLAVGYVGGHIPLPQFHQHNLSLSRYLPHSWIGRTGTTPRIYNIHLLKFGIQH